MKYILITFFIPVFFSSCSKDFETVAPYKETMVVYGLINQNESVQYLRIGKAYLGEGNVLVMAKQEDSIYYGDNLEVRLERLRNNFVEATDNLRRIDTVPKNAGIFVFPTQILYASAPGFVRSDDESLIYRLKITNKQSGHTSTSSTRSIRDLNVNTNNLRGTQYPIDFIREQFFQFYPSALAKIYNLTFRIRYIEESSFDTVNKSFDWNLLDKVISTNDTTTLVQYHVPKDDFFKALAENIEGNSTVKRRFDNPALEIHLGAGTEELNTYMQVTKPSSGVVQDRPLYTNIDNGVGLFTSRNLKIIQAALSQSTIRAMDTSAYTKHLNFR